VGSRRHLRLNLVVVVLISEAIAPVKLVADMAGIFASATRMHSMKTLCGVSRHLRLHSRRREQEVRPVAAFRLVANMHPDRFADRTPPTLALLRLGLISRQVSFTAGVDFIHCWPSFVWVPVAATVELSASPVLACGEFVLLLEERTNRLAATASASSSTSQTRGTHSNATTACA